MHSSSSSNGGSTKQCNTKSTPGDSTQWEKEPLQRLAKEGQLMAYKHTSFWQCMDTLREKHLLEQLWAGGNPPWKTWD